MKNNENLVSPDAVSRVQKCTKVFVPGALPWTPLRELTALPLAL